ncbi:MAG: RidA family protein [Dehalococcoidia bacterium]
MSHHLEMIHVEGYDPRYNMPYTPAVKARSGKTVFLAGVTAAPVYHSHPHIAAEFDDIPEEAVAQTEMAVANLRSVLQAAGGLGDVVQLFRFIKDLDKNQDAINATMARYLGDHRPPSTTVEIVRLATDPRLVLELAAVAVVAD